MTRVQNNWIWNDLHSASNIPKEISRTKPNILWLPNIPNIYSKQKILNVLSVANKLGKRYLSSGCTSLEVVLGVETEGRDVEVVSLNRWAHGWVSLHTGVGIELRRGREGRVMGQMHRIVRPLVRRVKLWVRLKCGSLLPRSAMANGRMFPDQ